MCNCIFAIFTIDSFLTTEPGQTAPAAAPPLAPSAAAAAPPATTSTGRATTENVQPRRMVAIFDYDPRESSPNTDIEVGHVLSFDPGVDQLGPFSLADWFSFSQAELTFSAGDIIHVFGDMDEDGFFYVSASQETQRKMCESVQILLKQ